MFIELVKKGGIVLLIVIDEELCIGCGLCEDSCPKVFKVGEDGVAHVIIENFEDCKNLEEVAEDCPMAAIIIKE